LYKPLSQPRLEEKFNTLLRNILKLEEEAEEARRACRRVHNVNPKTGKVQSDFCPIRGEQCVERSRKQQALLPSHVLPFVVDKVA
jgi:hypothetical protein